MNWWVVTKVAGVDSVAQQTDVWRSRDSTIVEITEDSLTVKPCDDRINVDTCGSRQVEVKPFIANLSTNLSHCFWLDDRRIMKQLTLLLMLILFTFVVPIGAQEKTASKIRELDPEMAERKRADDGLSWYDVARWGVEGRILSETERKRWFDRLPGAADGKVTKAVWNLSRHSAGMMVRFKTDATAIHVHYKLLNANLAMPHMPATGVSGVDLYARDDEGKWRWVQVTRPSSQEVMAQLVSDLAPGFREYAIYLPLYNGVEFLAIGGPPKSKFA